MSSITIFWSVNLFETSLLKLRLFRVRELIPAGRHLPSRLARPLLDTDAPETAA